MAETPTGETLLRDARKTLLHAANLAERLAKAVEGMEAAYLEPRQPTNVYAVALGLDETPAPPKPLHPADFYAPTTDVTGRVLDPNWTDGAPGYTHVYRKNAIKATLALREAIDAAIIAVPKLADIMDGDGPSFNQRWTTLTVGHLRKLRGAIVLGHGIDAFPSALPMIRVAVPAALRERARHIAERLEDVRTAIVAGVKPQVPEVVVPAEATERSQRVAKATDSGAIDGAEERTPENIVPAIGKVHNGDAKPQALPACANESAGLALTANQSRVLQTMARFDASRLLSSKMIADEMDASARLSEETVRKCVGKLIESQLAERPEGGRSGARLNNAGRKLAGKIAD